MKNGLVLSTFDGINLLGLAFRREGYCVVGGGDIIWGSEWDVRGLHPPGGVFEGVIGGPPCQAWTRLRYLNPLAGKDLDWVVGEFARVVEEAMPAWFLMEEVPLAPLPLVRGYKVRQFIFKDGWCGGATTRERAISFGSPDGLYLEVPRIAGGGSDGLKHAVVSDGRKTPVAMLSGGKLKKAIVLAGHGPVGHREGYDRNISLEEACEDMGLPRDFTAHMPFTMRGKRSVLGNGVPMAMGLAIARAVKRATVPR